LIGKARMTIAPSKKKSLLLSPYLLLVVAVSCWAGNFVLGRAIHSDIPPVTLTFWRWVVAGAVLLPFAGGALWSHRRTLLKHWKLIVVLAVTGVGLFHISVYVALQTTTATNAALVFATVPVLIPIMSLVLFREPVTTRQILGTAISLAGVTVVIVRGDPAILANLELTKGDLWILLAVLVWSIYSVLLRRVPSGVPILAIILGITGIGLVLIAPLYVWELNTIGGFELTLANLLSIAYVALFASVLAYICWNQAVGEVGANKAGLFSHLMPVISTLLAIVFLDEGLEGFHFAGIAAIAAGLYLTTTAYRTDRIMPKDTNA